MAFLFAAERAAACTCLAIVFFVLLHVVGSVETEGEGEDESETPPRTQFEQLQEFSSTDRRLRSGPILVINAKTFFIPNLHYDGQGADGHFWTGKGTFPSDNGTLVPDENDSKDSLKVYDGQNVYVFLPATLTVDDVDYFGVWDSRDQKSFGHVTVPKHLRVPKTGGIMVDNGKRIMRVQKCCPPGEVLVQRLGCTVVSNTTFDPSISVLENNETHLNDEPISAQLIKFEPFTNRITCAHHSFPLIPGEDKFWLLGNGSLIKSDVQRVLNFDDFCIESVDLGEPDKPHWKTTALVCFPEEERPPTNIYLLYSTGLVLSVICLAITAVVFFVYKEIRDARGVCIIGYSLSLATAFTFLAIAQLIEIDEIGCITIAYLVQVFLVSSFAWLMIIAWETYYKIINYDNDNYLAGPRHFGIYLSLGFLLPVFITVISYFIDRSPDLPRNFLKQELGNNTCFFEQGKTVALFFYGPVGVAIFITLAILVIIKWKLIQLQKEDDFNWRLIRNDLKALFRACALIAVIVTICWIWEILSYFEKPNNGISIAIDFITCLQGILVLSVFVLHRPVNQELKNKLRFDLKKWRRRKPSQENHTAEAVPLQGISNGGQVQMLSV